MKDRFLELKEIERSSKMKKAVRAIGIASLALSPVWVPPLMGTACGYSGGSEGGTATAEIINNPVTPNADQSPVKLKEPAGQHDIVNGVISGTLQPPTPIPTGKTK